MTWWDRLWRRGRLEWELDEELRAHLRMAIEDRVARGEPAGEAERNARREFGNQLLVEEVTRETWGWNAAERFFLDFRYAFRQIRRRPGFSAIIVATLAVGLGAVTAMFSIVNGVLLEPLHYREPGRLYLARTVPPARAKMSRDMLVNARHFHEWRTRCRSCEDVSLVEYQDLTLTGEGEPVRLSGLRVSYNFFRTLAVQPAAGRDFLPEEELPGHFGEVILSDSLWRGRFRGDPAIVGRAIQINGEGHVVVGVMPPGLRLPKGDEWGPSSGDAAEPLIFRPLGLDVAREYPAGSLNFSSVIRLRAGVSPARATGELNALLADFTRQYKLETKTRLVELQQQMTRNVHSALWLLFALVSVVLLMVSVNAGNLLLVSTAGRYREAGVRLAMGASRGALFSMVLKEASMLVLTGGACGWALAYAGLRAFVAAAPINLPRVNEVQMDGRVALVSILAAGLSTIACALLPAWRLSRAEPLESLKAGPAQTTEAGSKVRWRDTMAAIEVALCTILLITGGLLLASFTRLMQVEKGFEPTHVVTQDLSFLSPKYVGEVRGRVVRNLMEQLRQIPGAQAVGATSQLPLNGESWISGLRDPDQPVPTGEESAVANFRFVTPGYWDAMGIRLREGRYFRESDWDSRVAVITDRAAQQLWPGQSAIGRHVRGIGPRKPALEVVGVTSDVPAGGLEQTPPMMVYEPYALIAPVGIVIAVRTDRDSGAMMRAVRGVLASADPEMPLPPARSMTQIVNESVAPRKFEMYLAGGFAVAGLLVALLGLYGMISFSMARRTAELGIRIALGAPGRQLVGMAVRQGMRPAILGLAAGVALSLAGGNLVSSQLFGVTARDPLTYAVVVILMLTVALCACWIPARRVTRIDPLRALRCE